MLKNKSITAAIYLALPILAVPPLLAVASPTAAASNVELEDKIKTMESELKLLKKQVNKQPLLAGDTTFDYGGFIKFDAILSDQSDGERSTATIGDDILVPSTIPVGGAGGASGNDGATRFDTSIKTSRFWFKTNTATAAGAIKTHIELDMLTSDGDERISNSSNSRVRHAYLSWHYDNDSSLLVGQTWSTFMSTAVLPEAVDFIGPTSGVIFDRQAQLRWSKKLEKGSTLMLALENPSTGLIDGGGGIAGNNFDDNTLPDIVVRYDGSTGNFNYSAAAVVREIIYDTGTADDKHYSSALSFSGKYVFENGNDLKFQFNHGTLGRYIALQAFRDAAVESNGELELLDVTGGFVAYHHFWTKKLRSTFGYAMSSVDNPSVVAVSNNQSVSNYFANLFYSPVKKLSFGVEYMGAQRELENGETGRLKRLQFTSKFSF